MTGHFVEEGEMSIDDLREKLVKAGWRTYKSDFARGADWYACYPTDSRRQCASNNKSPQIVAQPYRATIDGKRFESVEISIRGAHPDENTWWDLKAYSMTPKDAWEKWEDVGRMLRRAWEAL